MALIQITYRCEECCSHCLVEAGPLHGVGMTKVNFTEAVSRIKRLLSPIEPLMTLGALELFRIVLE